MADAGTGVADAGATTPQTGGGPAPVAPPSDRSLSLDEYLGAGVPAHDRSWMGPDMQAAANALEALAAKGGAQLPRYQSDRSGELFDRMTHAENLEMLGNKGLPIDLRMQHGVIFLQAQNQVFKMYLNDLLTGKTGGAEMVELFGATLRTTAATLPLVKEFLATLDKNDPTYPTRINGLRQMRRGFANVIGGALQSLTESETFTVAERRKLLGYIRVATPSIVPDLPDGSRKELVLKANGFTKNPALQNLQPELNELAKEIELTVAGASSSLP